KKYYLLCFIFQLIFASTSYADQDATFRFLQIELGTLQAGYPNNKLLSEIPANKAFRAEVWYPDKLGTFQKHEWVEIVKLDHDKWRIQNPETGKKVEFSTSYAGGKLKIAKIEPPKAKDTTIAEAPAEIESEASAEKKAEAPAETEVAAPAQTETEAPAEEEIEQVKAVAAEQSQKDYIIASGDVLEITTWKEPDLSRDEIIVRTDGKITFPLLNDVQAAGLSALELKKVFENELKDYVDNPVVTVVVRRAESQKFYVLGEVINTGEYPLTKNVTVLQAVAMAGGFTEWASTKNIILMRKEDGKEKNYRINYNDIIKAKDLSQNLELKADDTIIVP
ncbi:MAG: polysaccharide biosynthesis/export family protein, partial [Deltaproteobacteria bacterium]|nr:polysaccharide biosynthesis/export family protein [Deltaproteobacteria bacterium]